MPWIAMLDVRTKRNTNQNCIFSHEISIFFFASFLKKKRISHKFSFFTLTFFFFFHQLFSLRQCLLGEILTGKRAYHQEVRRQLTKPKVMANSSSNSSREMLNQKIICSIRLFESAMVCSPTLDALDFAIDCFNVHGGACACVFERISLRFIFMVMPFAP